MAGLSISNDDKKKLYVLGGLLAAIGVVVVVLYVPHGGGTSTEPPVKENPTAPVEPPTPGGDTPDGPSPDGGAAAPSGGGTAPEGISAASLVSVQRYRNDPFAPYLLPPPPPQPTPAPPVVIPPPIYIPPPEGFNPLPIPRPGGGFGVPPMAIPNAGSGGGSVQRGLVGLAPPKIGRVAIAPRAPRNFSPPGGQTSGGGVLRSPNKRLSGIIIGDSVRAILEISDGETTTTRIVQPGDVVDDIRILRVERTSEAGRPVTRMYISENGEERYVDLQPAPQEATGANGGAPGAGQGGGPF